METTKTKGCGCGCGGGGGGCGCKPARLPEAAPALCSPCDTAAFVRPRFFAGQLLTEDDLGALIDYTVAKNRFHNARLFGEGVVCGLEVECGPCDSTQLVVKPGYALDCCGNDLVLTCERTLDLAQMIRDLQALQKGTADCTDPCPPATKPNDDKIETDASKTRHYCLYARYAERQDQPVASYPVGDDCDAARCEPTRVVEGVTFELRCPPCAKPPRTVHDALHDCKDLVEQQAELFALAMAAARVVGASRPRMAEAEIAAYDPERIEAAIAAKPAAEQYAVRYQVLAAAGPVLAHALHSKRELPGFGTLTKYVNQIADDIAKTEGAAAGTRLERQLSVDLAESWQLARDPHANLKSARLERFVAGDLWTDDVSRASAEHLALTAQRMKQLGGCLGKVHTDCQLRDAIEGLAPTWSADDPGAQDKAKYQLDNAIGIVQRFIADCECAAVNPPCQPCDDPGVLLACFDVDRCKVVRICNTVRHYVLAPTTLRYWGLVDLDLSRCCPRSCRDGKRKPGKYIEQRRFVPETMQMAQLAAARERDVTLYERLELEPRGDATASVLRDELAEMRRKLEACERKIKKLEGKA